MNAATQTDETWDVLYEAAREVLHETGPVFSMRRIARTAGYRLATLQHYFPRKSDLVEAVLGEGYRGVSEALDAIEPTLAAGGDPADAVAGLMVALYRFARSHRQLCRLRMATNLIAGQMSRASVQNLQAGVRRMQGTLPGNLDEPRLVLAVHALSVLTVRYSAHPPEELQTLLGTRTEGEANLLVEQHIADLARHLLNRSLQ